MSESKFVPLVDKPYVPSKSDYGLEFGGGYERLSLYHLGANIGWDVGTCIFTRSQTCQQYVDALGAVNGRDSETFYMVSGSLRWQFVNYPSHWSPFYRVMVGVKHAIVDDQKNGSFLLTGGGLGVTRYLHNRADVRFEARAFYAFQMHGEFLISIQFKLDEWVHFFEEKLRGIKI